MWVYNWKFKKRKSCCGFFNESANQFDFSSLMLVRFCNLLTKSKSCFDASLILEDTFILEFPQALLISTVRLTDNLAVTKTQNDAPQKHEYLSVYWIYQF